MVAKRTGVFESLDPKVYFALLLIPFALLGLAVYIADIVRDFFGFKKSIEKNSEKIVKY